MGTIARDAKKQPSKKAWFAIAIIFHLFFLCTHRAASLGPPNEVWVGGTLAAILTTLVLGELTETRQPSVYPKSGLPACTPDDFERLKNAAGASNEIGAILEKCRPAPRNIGPATIEITMLLPSGYCETISLLFQEVLSKYRSGNDGTPLVTASKIQFHDVRYSHDISFTYKNAQYYSTFRNVLESVEARSTCDSDGSLRVVVPRKI